ncbi:MAG: ABC transporter substrate-binding protein [Acuticoccus sp.]
MISKYLTAVAMTALIGASPALADDGPLRISSWGGSWRDMIADTIAKKFTEETGVEVEFLTGGTIDRLNKAKLAKGDPESDITFTTSHVGWLYENDGLFEKLDLSKVPNAENLFAEAKISPGHVGIWSYVYTIAYRPDLMPEGVTLTSWADLWKPELAGTIGLPDFDPSHIIAASAKLEGADATEWEKGQDKLKALKPNIKAFYTNDANSQQLIASGETPIQVLLSMNGHYMMSEGVPIEIVIPEEGAIIGIDTIGIMAGTDKLDLAYKFLNAALDPEVQAEIVRIKRGGPAVANATVDPELADLPGVLTTADEWESDALVIDHKLRAEKLGEWRQWFTENMIAQ